MSKFVLSVLRHHMVQKLFPSLADAEFFSEIQQSLTINNTQGFIPQYNIDSIDAGLQIMDRQVTLSEDWGVTLTANEHFFIDNPGRIRIKGPNILVTNTAPSPSTASCSIVDLNMNYVAPVGKIGNDLEAGEYTAASDFNLDAADVGNRYYIVSALDHIIHAYNTTTFEYESTIGTGTAGVTGGALTSPVAMDMGYGSNYILCSSGTPSGATGAGYIIAVSKAGVLGSVGLFCGKNNGTGLCAQGEVLNPKDLFVVPGSSYDTVYILNGTNEIGKFRSDTWALLDVYNIPSEFLTANMGLSCITVSNNVLYVTATTRGKIFAIDLQTRKYLGSFGSLRAETTSDSPGTLGYFNGLTGIAVLDDRLLVTEVLNDRIQALGKSLIQKGSTEFSVTFSPVAIPPNKRVRTFTLDLYKDEPSETAPRVVIVDLSTNKEISIKTAIDKQLKSFSIRLKINPMAFSKLRPGFDISPVYVLLE